MRRFTPDRRAFLTRSRVMDTTAPQTIRPEDAAERFGVSIQKIRLLAQQGKVARFFDPRDRRKFLYSVRDLERCFTQLEAR